MSRNEVRDILTASATQSLALSHSLSGAKYNMSLMDRNAAIRLLEPESDKYSLLNWIAIGVGGFLKYQVEREENALHAHEGYKLAHESSRSAGIDPIVQAEIATLAYYSGQNSSGVVHLGENARDTELGAKDLIDLRDVYPNQPPDTLYVASGVAALALGISIEHAAALGFAITAQAIAESL